MRIKITSNCCCRIPLLYILNFSPSQINLSNPFQKKSSPLKDLTPYSSQSHKNGLENVERGEMWTEGEEWKVFFLCLVFLKTLQTAARNMKNRANFVLARRKWFLMQRRSKKVFPPQIPPHWKWENYFSVFHVWK